MREEERLRGDRFRVLTFDCYGTLVDWETGIWEAFLEAARDSQAELDRKRLIRAYHEIEPLVEAGHFRSYREVLTETAARVAARCGWRISREEASFLPRSLPSWPVFEDTGQALERLADRFRIGILSNVDDDLLEGTIRGLPVEFDFTVTAERIGSYKPAPLHFDVARGEVGETGGWLHVAGSLFHDVDPAARRGIPVVWVNRKEEPWRAGAAVPDWEVPDLATLAERLLAPA